MFLKNNVCVFLCVLLLPSLLGFAQTLYTWTDERGVVHFSDKAPSASQETARVIPLPKLMNISAPAQTDQLSKELRQPTAEVIEKTGEEPPGKPEIVDSQQSSEGPTISEPPATRSQRIADTRVKKSEAIQGRFSRTMQKKASENQRELSTVSGNDKENASNKASKEIASSEAEGKKTFDWNDL